MTTAYDIKDASLKDAGVGRILWAERSMPVLRAIRERFEKEKPLEGMKIAACLHVTTETANLARTLQAGGAHVRLCASNPLSTQDETAAALALEYGIDTFAVRGAERDHYYQHIDSALTFGDEGPDITMDDGADLVSQLHSKRTNLLDGVLAGTEETTTGVIRLRSMTADGALKYPIIAVNDADTKHFFDNRYGTGQSTLDGILRATNILLAGMDVVIAGYGWCGRGLADRARGMGARVIITEIEPVRALQAHMDGFTVLPMAEAAKIGDVFVTLTGDKHVLRKEHFEAMKDGAILCNSGHFDVEIDIPTLEEMASEHRTPKPLIDEYVLSGGRSIFLLAQGRLVNLSAAEGHPASVMDMSFANQALSSEWLVKNAEGMEPQVLSVPKEIDRDVARLKLECMGVRIDTLTAEQEKYLSSWEEGT
jgi:adenosylhomocysteinase